MDINSHELNRWDWSVCILAAPPERRLQAAEMGAIELLPPEGGVPILSNTAFYWNLNSSFKSSGAVGGVGGAERRASVLDCGSPLPLFHRKARDAKAAEGCRSPRPRGSFRRTLRTGHSFN